MKDIQKMIAPILLTAVLLLAALCAIPTEDPALPGFCVQSPAGEEPVSIFDAQDGNYYVFLPSYADMSRVTVRLSGRQEILLGGIPLQDHMTCDLFEPEKTYDFTVNGEKTADLRFLQSQSVATMYLNTASGTTEHIHNDKNHEEYVSMTLYTADGSVSCSDDSSTLKGRGNATWECDKRPYLLTLSTDRGLLDMPAAGRWILLANAMDETNLNNKLTFDLASRVDFQWSPATRFVDLYLNGEYRGLYLLTEKAEVQENRLNIDADAGEFLCKIDFVHRWDSLRNPFTTAMQRTVEISYPQHPSAENAAAIALLVNQMEAELCSGADLQKSEILDLDSWVRRYLIDEISGNIDSDLASSYFHFSGGKFHAGPVWDYDIAFGNRSYNQNPQAFTAKNKTKYLWTYSPYHSALYDNPSFYNRMVEIYRTEFAPVLQEMADHGIDDLIRRIAPASRMNSIRWQEMFSGQLHEESGTVHTPTALRDYFIQRIRFLNSAWLDGTDYCTLQFKPVPDYNISVEKGSCLETDCVDLVNTVWIDSETGSAVDFSQPITRDMVLTVYVPAEEPSAEDVSVEEPVSGTGFTTAECITLLSLGGLCLLLLALLAADTSRRRKERRAARDRNRSEISP